jgi:hypothetical protein
MAKAPSTMERKKLLNDPRKDRIADLKNTVAPSANPALVAARAGTLAPAGQLPNRS